MTTRPPPPAGTPVRRAALAVLLLLGAALAAACGGGGEEPAPTAGASSGVRPAGTPARAADAEAMDAWAEAMCELQVEFDRRAAALNDGVDPTTLDLAARKARYQRIGPRQVELYRETERALSQIDPAPGADFFHRALLLQVRALAAALARQAELVDAAAPTGEIAATNQDVEQVRRRSAAEVRFAEQAMPGPLRTALAGCGGAGGLGVP